MKKTILKNRAVILKCPSERLLHPSKKLSATLETFFHPCDRLAGTHEKAKHPSKKLSGNL
ncbi:hypothetical protein [Chryseobacterium sp. CFS15]|uniref:hypothetical protein n=1 Tax=Chryseobacterium sp. CFS15 TaxID=2986946 RepID=UPI002807210E|nr:hypothetical protein [Chryseobacterium sp. CFS15]MDQ8143094.1 hypothetical protein [Chryseobacterium sp. CFS15]